MNQEVIMLKSPSAEDWIDGWDRPTSLGRFTRSLNSMYFPQFDSSELRKALTKSGINRSQMFLQMTVKCIPGTNIVESIYLYFISDDDINAKRPTKEAQYVLSDYFKSIGFPGTTCITSDDIASFVERMAQDLPIINEYLQIH